MSFNPIPFGVGDRVIHPIKLVRGTVLEIDDGIAYIELDTGVEMDFPVTSLEAEAEYKSPEETAGERLGKEISNATTIKVAELILPEVRNMFVALAQMKAEQAGVAVVLLGGSAAPWEQMNDFHRMNFICVTTGTKFSDWVDAYNEHKMDEFQQTIITNLEEILKKKSLTK